MAKVEAKNGREEARSFFLAEKPAARDTAVLFGREVDLVQPTLGEMIQVRELTAGPDPLDPDAEDTVDTGMALSIIRFVCLPGTNERIFNEDDGPAILKWPFSQELSELQEKITALAGFGVDEAKTELANSPLDG